MSNGDNKCSDVYTVVLKEVIQRVEQHAAQEVGSEIPTLEDELNEVKEKKKKPSKMNNSDPKKNGGSARERLPLQNLRCLRPPHLIATADHARTQLSH